MSRTVPPTGTSNGSLAEPFVPSNAHLFVTNLRLLDIDKLPDWPGITVQTFSTREASQNQKQRIRCVEWGLFRLFELWDPAEAMEKLQPFFPPLEPLQSLNLRTALYRSLNELKKNGMLGRETTLRKTMLDDCAGPKLLEVLAVFSTNVVKAVLDDSHGGSPTIVKRLALAQALDERSQQSMLPLVMAHKASLNALLRRKARLDESYGSLSRKLNELSQDLETREANTSRLRSQKQLPAIDAISMQVRDNWTGNAKWADDLLHGEGTPGDYLLASRFDDVWHATSNGLGFERRAAVDGLQARLEQRIQQQRRRVAQWRGFQEKLKQSAPYSRGDMHPDPKLRFTFDDHKQLKIGGQSSEAGTNQLHTDDGSQLHSNNGSQLRSNNDSQLYTDDGPQLQAITAQHTYDGLIAKMREQLVSGASATHGSAGRRSGFGAVSERDRVTSSKSAPLDGWEASKTQPLQTGGDSRILDTEVDVTPHSSHGSGHPRPGSPPDHVAVDVVPPPRTPNAPDEPDSIPEGTPGINAVASSPPIQQSYSLPASREEDLVSQTEQPAANPRRLTLADRTRLSMAPRTHQRDTLAAEEQTSLAAADDEQSLNERSIEVVTFDRRASLLDRTRQSMSFLPTGDVVQQHRSRKSVAGRPAKRTSMFPINQFETPRRKPSHTLAEIPGEGDSGQSTPRETLFSDDAEYNSVFKSRPRIALSPVVTPQDEVLLDTVLDAVDGDTSYNSSPLVRR